MKSREIKALLCCKFTIKIRIIENHEIRDAEFHGFFV